MPDIACHSVLVDGDQIRAAREARGWTQEELAERLSVGPRTVGNWERGVTKPKTRAGKIRAVLGITEPEPPSTDPLRSASEIALLAELMRRAERRLSRPRDEGSNRS